MALVKLNTSFPAPLSFWSMLHPIAILIKFALHNNSGCWLNIPGALLCENTCSLSKECIRHLFVCCINFVLFKLCVPFTFRQMIDNWNIVFYVSSKQFSTQMFLYAYTYFTVAFDRKVTNILEGYHICVNYPIQSIICVNNYVYHCLRAYLFLCI